MKDTPINYDIVNKIISESNIANIGTATIRELKKLVNDIEKATGQKFIRMEMGIPGLPPAQVGVDAEIAALKKGCASIYPDIEGIPSLKVEMVRFMKLFLGIDLPSESCIPTVGSMQASYASFMTISRMYKEKDTTLFLDPGFPVHKRQHDVIGIKYESFDVYDFRGDKLKDKIEFYLQKGNIASILYSNPNNPSWICFTEKELKIIAELADQYNVIVIEDLAYFGMDFRKDYSHPGIEPHQPTIAKYTENYTLLISGSKVFSYAGQRIGVMVISPKLFHTKAPDLKRFFKSDIYGTALILGTMYALSAGTAHSTQHALGALLKAANDGTYNFVEYVKEYGEKAKIMKKIFIDNGFKIVYDMDEDKPIADGFYFTYSYPGFTGEQLLQEMIYYGVSAISLAITGSSRLEGMRACVSLVPVDMFAELDKRLKQFHENHPY